MSFQRKKIDQHKRVREPLYKQRVERDRKKDLSLFRLKKHKKKED
jgi:hypothetical protein